MENTGLDLTHIRHCLIFLFDKGFNAKQATNDEAELVTDLNAYFASKDQSFFERGIHSLPDRWQLTIDYEGDYFVEG